MGEPGKKKNVDDLIRHTVAAVDADRKRLQVRREWGGYTLQCTYTL